MHLTGIDVSRLPAVLTSRMTVEGECWVWTGARHPQGHGIVYLGEGTWEYTHRLAYAWTHGGIPDGHIVHHECETKPCFRPDHLRAVTPKEHSAEHGLTGVAAMHAAKTHCPAGHLYDRVDARQRSCSICRRAYQRDWERKRRRLAGCKPAPAERTHCPAGHPYDDVNTYVTPDGKRMCRTCHRERQRRRTARSGA